MEIIKLNENQVALLDPETSKKIAEFETQIKAIKEQEEQLKEMILNEMETKGIIKVETDELIINYIASVDRETFDTKEFRKANQDLYDQYVKFTPVKPSIRIKVK